MNQVPEARKASPPMAASRATARPRFAGVDSVGATVSVAGAATPSTPTAAVRVSPVSEPIAKTEYDVPPARSRAPGSSGQTVLSAFAQTMRS